MRSFVIAALAVAVALPAAAEEITQKSKDLNQLYKDAAVAQHQLATDTKAIADAHHCTTMIPPELKGRPRAEEKIRTDYNNDASRILDLARASIVCTKAADVTATLAALKHKYGAGVVRVKDRFAKPVNGYRDIMTNVKMANGHIVELQIHLKAILDVKGGVGHKLYEKIRSLVAKASDQKRELEDDEVEAIAAAEAQMKKAYDDAYAAASK